MSQGKSVAVSPFKSSTSQCSASTAVVTSLGQNWKERDSGLSQSLLPGHESTDGQGEEVEKLLEECRTALGIAASQDKTLSTTGKSEITLSQ